jgi:hypothetical protein
MKDINRVLEGLDTSFDAAVAASDDEAANDLAYSLSQGFTLTHALSRWPGVTWHIGNGIVVSAEEIAADHVVALGGTLVAPLNRLVATRSEGPPVRVTEVDLVRRLRRWARVSAMVQVTDVAGEVWEGSLTRAAEDHVEIQSNKKVAIVSTGAIALIRLCHGG